MSVPLVVVTGFLGAGKTTLINRLLARRRERADQISGKLAVIVNELGEIGIDGDLLGGETTRQIELPGGCVCCVLGDELGTTLIDLVERNPALDAIVLETTGVAEPLPIAWAVEREPVASRVRLAAVVTLIDASNFLTSRQVSTSVDEQVANADVLLMTKAELASASVLEEVHTVVRELAPSALTHTASVEGHAETLETLLADPVLPDLPVSSSNRQDGNQVRNQFRNHIHNHVHDENCRDDDRHAAHGIDSVWVPVPAPVDLEELADQLAALPSNYVRIKGIMRSRSDGSAPAWIAIHRVGPRVSSEVIDAPRGREDLQQGRIVALGPSVTREELARCVAMAIGV